MRNQKVLFSSSSNDWQTPLSLFNPIREAFNIRLDPCADESNNLEVPIYYTKEGNGLTITWHDNAFINPPYSDIESWVDKTKSEFNNKTKNIHVMLLPSRTDRPWFRKLLLGAQTIVFLKKRVRFSGMKSGAPFPSIIAIFHSKELNREQQDVLDELGYSITNYTVMGDLQDVSFVKIK